MVAMLLGPSLLVIGILVFAGLGGDEVQNAWGGVFFFSFSFLCQVRGTADGG